MSPNSPISFSDNTWNSFLDRIKAYKSLKQKHFKKFLSFVWWKIKLCPKIPALYK